MYEVDVERFKLFASPHERKVVRFFLDESYHSNLYISESIKRLMSIQMTIKACHIRLQTRDLCHDDLPHLLEQR